MKNTNATNVTIKRGEIYLVNLNNFNNNNSIQTGLRPVLVVSNDINNRHSTNITVVPLTSKLSKKQIPTHIFVGVKDGLIKDSLILCEQIMTITKDMLHKKLINLTNDKMKEVNRGLDIQLGIAS